MRHGSLFSGIGGFDLAASWLNWENVFHCEINEFGQKILKYYWPNAISYGDITKTDFTIHRGGIDILTGGVPCQPASVVGQRKGETDDRWLWPEMLRVVREIKPPFVVCENPTGIISLGYGKPLESILSSLEDEGFQIELFIIPSCAIQAPHKRERIWIIAYSKKFTSNSIVGGKFGLFRKLREVPKKNTNTGNYGCEVNTPDSNCVRQQGQRKIIRPMQSKKNKERETNRINCNNEGDGWRNFPTQSPLCSRDDGISSRLDGITFSKWRNESIKAYGNAIVPQIALQLFKAIEQYSLKMK
jgi:DNA (cytosine-5)-methyltransferase 1